MPNTLSLQLPINSSENNNLPDYFTKGNLFTRLLMLLQCCYFCQIVFKLFMLNASCHHGKTSTSWHCYTCKKRVFWKSRNISVKVSAAAFSTRIRISTILEYFIYLFIYFKTAKKSFGLLSNAITYFNNIITTQELVDICIDSQFDSLRFSAMYCVVSTTKKF